MSAERERKFLIDQLPAVLDDGVNIEQGYLAIDGQIEVRLRRNDLGDAVLTIKGGSGSTRTEIECPISREQLAALWPFTAGRRVHKTRYRIDDQQHIVELDVFADEFGGLLLAEVEFEDEATMDAYQPPPWFGREVSDDPAYSNAKLAR